MLYLIILLKKTMKSFVIRFYMQRFMDTLSFWSDVIFQKKYVKLSFRGAVVIY